MTAASSARVYFIQDGGRLHYALPRALQRAGELETMYTDFYCIPGCWESKLAAAVGRRRVAAGRKLQSRYSEELDVGRVSRDAWFFFKTQAAQRFFRRRAEYYRWTADAMGRAALRRGFGRANVAMGYVRHLSPAWLKAAREQGLRTIADQIIAPAQIETAETLRQHERWPGWESASESFAADQEVVARHEAESYEQLDRVTCASQYVRSGLIEIGLNPERIDVLPYPIEGADWPVFDRSGRKGPITVGFVGSVGLRKGAPYFFEAARRFDPSRARFEMVGPVGITEMGLARRGSVELTGSVPRSEVLRRMEAFDVYYFPSTCEGSAGSLMEAMATGLPVVTSPNSGTAARDGVEGFIVPYDDVEAAVERIDQLVRDAELRREMGMRARRRAESFSIDWYAGAASKVLETLVGAPAGPPISHFSVDGRRPRSLHV
jgi:glycosyltransferase involved in cell wall biosynthesis